MAGVRLPWAAARSLGRLTLVADAKISPF